MSTTKAFSLLIVIFLSMPLLIGKEEKPNRIFSEDDFLFIANKWKNCDGESCSIISNWFCEVLIIEPELFFSEMEKQPGLFEKWSEELSELSLKSYGGCIDTECFRKTIVSNLSRWKAPEKFKERKEKLLQVLEKAKNLKVD